MRLLVMIRATVLAMGAAFATAASAAGATITVGPGGGYDYEAIQHAIYAAVNGDVVEVADGLYAGPGNRDIEFCGKVITVRAANGPENCIVDCGGSYAEPHRAFVFHLGEGNDAVLEGMTIRNGYAYYGGGVYCHDSSPTIRNCHISHCAALRSGGGLYAAGSQLAFENSVVSHNSSDGSGGGLSLTDCETVLRDCRIVSNTAGSNGGGIMTWSGNASVLGCFLAGNECGINGDGGAVWAGRGEGAIVRNVFVGNHSVATAGAVDLHETGHFLSDNILTGNTCSLTGGAVRVHLSNSVLGGNRFVGNHSDGEGGLSGSTGSYFKATSSISPAAFSRATRRLFAAGPSGAPRGTTQKSTQALWLAMSPRTDQLSGHTSTRWRSGTRSSGATSGALRWGTLRGSKPLSATWRAGTRAKGTSTPILSLPPEPPAPGPPMPSMTPMSSRPR